MPRIFILACLLLASCRSTDSGRLEDEKAVTPAIAAPQNLSEARALWRREGPEAAGAIADYYEIAERPRPPQEHFDLLRELSAGVPPGHPSAPEVVRAITGYLRREAPTGIQLSGEVLPPPWHVIVRLIVGTRISSELSPVLERTIQDELEKLERIAKLEARTSEAHELPPAVSPPLRNSIYALGYLRLRRGAELARRCVRLFRGEDRVLALNVLAQTGDAASGSVLLETLATSAESREIAAAANAAAELLEEGAESHLVALSRDASAKTRAISVFPLFRVCTPTALSALASLRSRSDGEPAARLIHLQLRRHAKALAMSEDDLLRMIESSPALAAERMFPNARRQTFLRPGERRLSHEQLTEVLVHWKEKSTIYTEEWSWVRDRHIIDAARLGDVRKLEDVRVAVLREYRTTCVNEAEILQRIISAIQRRADGED
jgi:hypothetical protein